MDRWFRRVGCILPLCNCNPASGLFFLCIAYSFLLVALTASVSERDGAEQLTQGKGKSENFEKKTIKGIDQG